jgi:ABC-type arginine transport system ATPase subunit
VTLTIQTVLEPQGPATAIELTDEQVAQLGAGKRAAVLVTIGDQTARLRLAVMGGRNLIGLSRAVRNELGVDIGDEVTATIEPDVGERTVEVPEELATALGAEPSLQVAFDELSYTQRKEHARSVSEAKRPETRARRVEAVLNSLQVS